MIGGPPAIRKRDKQHMRGLELITVWRVRCLTRGGNQTAAGLSDTCKLEVCG